ncbi:MAG: thermonuclease family protein, partial [Chloroflexota bacterium]|nr:thermonuclease family protein [Chloroflexota bacterium]
ERQATDVDAQGNWVRDVWVDEDQGQFLLVSEALVGEGAAEADVTEPNTRFAGWLMAAQSSAQSAGDGLWTACEPEASGPPAGPQGMTIPPPRLTARRIQYHLD